ncbi:MAG: hypothetical protein PF961_20390 [Planctomycetota bacterium]|jgi:ElaB/YqjD/DUF883 family membrane-anchored ribosome-binding protein|nr:hypothetical protein [Planctomycetota bacterium]
MNQPVSDTDHDSLTDHARALLAETSDAVGEKVGETRDRLSAAIDGGKKAYGKVNEQVTNGAKAADKAVHKHPYGALAIGVGVGALLGFLVTRRFSHCDR